jgi:large subunit ribosomal protein L2
LRGGDGGRLRRLTRGKLGSGGRNNQGRITAFHRGGGNKKLYRIIDFKRSLFDCPGIVKFVTYDPNRTSEIALVNYKNGILSYILAPKHVSHGDTIAAGPLAEIKAGNALPLGKIPVGTLIHNIEFKPGQGGKLVRAAGGFAKIIKRDHGPPSAALSQGRGDKGNPFIMTAIALPTASGPLASSQTVIRLSSGRLYSLSPESMATIGTLGNESHRNLKLRKAGQNR